MEYRLNHTKGFHGKPKDTPRKKLQANAHAAVAFISPCIFFPLVFLAQKALCFLAPRKKKNNKKKKEKKKTNLNYKKKRQKSNDATLQKHKTFLESAQTLHINSLNSGAVLQHSLRTFHSRVSIALLCTIHMQLT